MPILEMQLGFCIIWNAIHVSIEDTMHGFIE